MQGKSVLYLISWIFGIRVESVEAVTCRLSSWEKKLLLFSLLGWRSAVDSLSLSTFYVEKTCKIVFLLPKRPKSLQSWLRFTLAMATATATTTEMAMTLTAASTAGRKRWASPNLTGTARSPRRPPSVKRPTGGLASTTTGKSNAAEAPAEAVEGTRVIELRTETVKILN
jgi:hypothetical protein